MSENNPLPGENWTCPYCNRHQVISETRFDLDITRFYDIENCEIASPGYAVRAIVCANPACRKISLTFWLGTAEPPPRSGRQTLTKVTKRWQLLPESPAKPQPPFIPRPLVQDYLEACAILDLSPKASATLARRCLQGMIRDFCKISRRTLDDEIKALRIQVAEGHAPPGVQADSVEAIDHVRGIGNIGAHMEKDINVIVDVDPDEAQQLIGLIELLFEEWYVAREDRARRLAELKELGEKKKAERKKPPSEEKPPEEPKES